MGKVIEQDLFAQCHSWFYPEVAWTDSYFMDEMVETWSLTLMTIFIYIAGHNPTRVDKS